MQAPAPSLADGTADSGSTEFQLSLDELQNLALQYNPTLMQAHERVESARGLRIQAGLKPNPTISYIATEMGNEGKAGQHGVVLNLPFVTAGKLPKARAVAGWAQEQANVVRFAQEEQVRNSVRREYYAVLAAEKRRSLAEQLVKRFQEGFRDTKARTAFDATDADVYQAEFLLHQAAMQLGVTRSQHSAAWRRLTAVVGRPMLPPAPLTGSLTEGIPELTWDDVSTRLVAESPQISRARLGINRTRAALQLEEARGVPNLQFEVATQYDNSTNTQFVSLITGFQLPIRNWNQGNVIRAAADYRNARREVDRVELALKWSFAQTFQQYEIARNRVKQYQTLLIPTATKSLDANQKLYEAREISSLQLQIAQRLFTTTNQDYLQALANLWQSAITIEGMMLVDGLSNPANQLQSTAVQNTAPAPNQPANWGANFLDR